MRHILIFITLCLAVAASVSCGGETLEEIEARAGQTAVEYYRHLQQGRYADFVAGMEGADSLPSDYRKQMEENAAMFLKQQNEAHHGIRDITLRRCSADTASKTAEALLDIHYSDSTVELVCVPLVCRSGTWLMK